MRRLRWALILPIWPLTHAKHGPKAALFSSSSSAIRLDSPKGIG
jgi:hypothetical protein